MELIVDVRKIKKCAFCKYWYDPANTAIEPRSPQMGLWKIVDTNKKCKCLKKNLEMPAHATCGRDYACKI